MTRQPMMRFVLLTVLIGLAALARAAEPVACLSTDPSAWPQPSKPYVLIVADTSTSMSTAVGSPAPTCVGYSSDRRGHLRCALNNVMRTYGGLARFGLMRFARKQQSCSATCYTNCVYSDFPNNQTAAGCGPGTGATRAGGFIATPIATDAFWTAPPVADTILGALGHTDNICSDNAELFADGGSPIAGALRDVKRYLAGSWTAPDGSVTYTTPLDAQDRACRKVIVVVIADGGETCDTVGDANAVATDLATVGVSAGANVFRPRVHVLDFSGGSASTELDAIASAGLTTAAVDVTRETDITVALGAIIQAQLSSETCDNSDNNCNGCTDEGYRHLANVQTTGTCCAWASTGQRNSCLNNFRASITPANPLGTTSLLPCTTPAQSLDPNNWLCNDVGETCDNVDNNGDGQVDEGQRKCGLPAHCPVAETCNGQDDDCDGVIDNGLPCAGQNITAEVCDGCDNDFNGIADDGVAPIACGTSPPATCAGTQSCRAPQPVTPGGCVVGGGFQACSNSPQTEVCDGLDNNCNGIVDDGIAPVVCTAPGTPNGLVYGGTSQCTLGQQACGGTCIGFVGPTGEVTDGIDNDCDGTVDNLFQFKNGFE